MKEISVKITCNGCGKPYPETIESSSDQWELDLPVRVGDNAARALDLCPACTDDLLRLVDTGEILKRTYKPKVKAPEKSTPKRKQVRQTSGEHVCTEPFCSRSFSTAHGLAMHRVRMHAQTYNAA